MTEHEVTISRPRIRYLRSEGEIPPVGWAIVRDERVYKDGEPVGLLTSRTEQPGRTKIIYVSP
jgi:hypothetical protein